MLKKIFISIFLLTAFNVFSQDCTPLNSIPIQDTIEICRYDTLRFSSDTALRYQWKFNETISADTFFRITGEGQLTIEISLNGCDTLFDTTEIIFPPTPVANLLNTDTVLCMGDTLKLNSGGALNVLDFIWDSKQINGNEAFSIRQDSILDVIFDDTKNSRNVYMFIVNLYGFCTKHYANTASYIVQDTAFVFFANPPIVELGADTTLCESEEEFVLEALPSDVFLVSEYDFLWKDGNETTSKEPDISVTTDNKGLQIVRVLNRCGDTVSDSVNIDFWPKEWTESKLVTDTSVCQKIRVTLDATADVHTAYTQYLWLHDSSSNPIITIAEPKTYEVIITDSAGCQRKHTSNVSEDDCTAKIEMPNIFTPDGDGINDFFKPMPTPERIYNFEIRIYDRWGRAVFKYEGDVNGCQWNGNNGNKAVPEGVYFWGIKYTDVFDKKFDDQGTVTLLRSR